MKFLFNIFYTVLFIILPVIYSGCSNNGGNKSGSATDSVRNLNDQFVKPEIIDKYKSTSGFLSSS